MRFLLNLIKKPFGCIFSLLAGLLLLLIVLGVVGVLVADHFAVGIASTLLQQHTGFSMTVGQQDISALSGAADLHDLQILNPARFPIKEFVHLKECKIKVELASLRGPRAVVDELVLDVDSVAAVQTKDHEFNLVALKTGLADQTLPPFIIKKLTLRIGTAKYFNNTMSNPGPTTASLNYERTFTDVTNADLTKVTTEVAADLSAKGAAFMGGILMNNVLGGVTDAVKAVGATVQGVGNAIKNLTK